jgi:hypothetical protein
MAGAPFWRQNLPYIVIALIDVFAIGIGLSLPILAVLYGFGVGWWLVRRGPHVLPESLPETGGPAVERARIRSLLAHAAALAVVTLVVLVFVWAGAIPVFLDPAVDAAELGVPLLLWASQPSKIAWLVLLFVAGPLAQFMAVVTAGTLAFARTPRAKAGP